MGRKKAEAMKIGALAPWFGGKRTLAPDIVRQLGPHRCYWEIFCGSCAVLFAKPKCSYETVNDLHVDLVNLALVVQDAQKAQELYARCHRTLFIEKLCRVSRERLSEPLESPAGDGERAYWYLVFSWFGVNGVAGTPMNRTGSFCVRYTSKGGNGPVRWRAAVESIPDWHERLLGVQILSQDALRLAGRIEDREGTVIYADPPYVLKGAKYVHDADDAPPVVREILGIEEGPLPEFAWHLALAKQLNRFERTRVVVSYYAHPLLAELYPGWTVVDCATAKSLVNSGMRDGSGRTEAPEVLLINAPAVGEEAKPSRADQAPGLFGEEAG